MRKIKDHKFSLILIPLLAAFSLFITLPHPVEAEVNAITPSTNEINKANGWAHVDAITKVGAAELTFIQPRNFRACFEYRTDGDTSQVIDEEHPLETYQVVDVSEGLQLYPYFCLNTISTHTETISANEYVEVRMLFGAEGDERFDWTRFDVLQPPTIPELEYPIGGSYINDNTPLMQWSDSTDSDGSVSGYYYRIFYNCTDELNIPNSCSVYPNLLGLWRNISEYQAGTTLDRTYYWQVKAVDNEDNESEWSDLEEFTIDTVAPQTPTGLYFRDTVNNKDIQCGERTNAKHLNVHWEEVTEDPSFSHFEYSSFNAPSGMPGIVEKRFDTNYFNSSWWTIPMEGTYGVQVRSVDKAENKSEWFGELVGIDYSCQFIVDWTAPIVELISPANNFYTNTGSFVQKWTSSDTDIKNYQYRSCSNDPTSESCNQIYSTTTMSTSRTVNNDNIIFWWQVRATDTAGNVGPWADPRKATMDSIAPTVEITSHKENQFVAGVQKISGVVEDLNLSHYWFVIYNSLNQKVAGPGVVHNSGPIVNPSFDWDTEQVPDGEYTIKLEARDLANNKDMGSMHWVKVIVDNADPEVKITSPAEDSHLSGTVDIRGWVADTNLSHYNIAIYNEGDDVRDFSLRIEQKTEYTSEFGEKILYTWDTTNGNFPDGRYQIRLAARDLAGNRDMDGPSEEVITVVVDNTPPETTITTPSSGYITNEEPEIIGYTEDGYSVDKVVLSYTDYNTDTSQCGDTWTELTTINNPDKETLPFDWSYDEWTLEDGAYCIKAQGTDLAGNEEHTAIIENVIYDTTPPKITLLDLVLGILNVTADDLLSGQDKIEVSPGNGIWELYAPDMDLNDLVGNQPGTYTIYVRVTDKAGNTTVQSTSFTIPSPTPTTTQTGGEILGVTSPLNPTPVEAFGTGGYTIAQTEGENKEEEEAQKEEKGTEDNPGVKGEEDTEAVNTEEEIEGEGIKWWVYPLVILPILAIFLILWKRRKEENEPQF